MMDFVSSYVLMRGQKIVLVDTSPSNNGAKLGEVITIAGLGWGVVGGTPAPCSCCVACGKDNVGLITMIDQLTRGLALVEVPS